MIIIIDNILTPYEIARYNSINKQVNGELFVFFQNKNEQNREWKNYPKTHFNYRIAANRYKDLAEFLNKNKSQIEHIVSCGYLTPAYLYALAFAKRNHIHSTLWWGSTRYENRLRKILLAPFIKSILKLTDDFIAYGTRSKKYLISLGVKAEKISIFLNSVDVDYFKEQSNILNKDKLLEKYRLPPRAFTFLFIGQLIDRKGIKELLSAVNILISVYPDLYLIIAGTGPLSDYVKNQAAKSKNIKYLGFVDYDVLPEIFAVSRTLVLPSKEEVWGLVVNEALSSGLPVLVSRFAGCVDDLVVPGKNGEIIKNISTPGISTAMEKFIRSFNNYQITGEMVRRMRNQNYSIINH